MAKFSKNTGMNAKVGNTLKSNPMFSLKEKSGMNSVEILPQIIGLLKKNIPPRDECQLLSCFFYIFSNLIVTTHTIINIVCVISAAEDPQGKQALCPRVCLDISCVIINRLDSVGLNGIWYNQNDEWLHNQDMIVMM